MFFTYAEKQGNVFFDGWQMRQVAFDTLRRHLYYSDYVPPEKIAYPNAYDNPLPEGIASQDSLTDGDDSVTSLATANENPAIAQLTMRVPVSPVNQQRRFNEAPPPPNNPEDVQWRKKIKVDMIVPVGKEHAFLLEDTHLKETDLFQIEIHGEVRPMAAGETPSPGPLLCPSAGLSGLPERCTVENDEFVRDPVFLRELYEALRDQFANLRMERERAEMASGQPVLPPSARKTQTLESPRPKNGTVYRGSRIKVIIRMRTDYEFRRFWYVVQTVLGYDKLSARPYRGLPPYDPRNGLIFAMIPMCVWHTFKSLDKAVFYTFLRGDLVGRNASNQLCVTLRGAYLCITHDTVIVMRDTGNIPRWIKLQQVREFHYNAASSRPFVSFLSDPGAPDIIFIPQPPIYGPDAIRRFSPSLEVLRLYHIIHETCFASLEIRRVINIQEIPEMSVRGFVARYERETGRTLDFDPARGYAGVLSCPLPKEQLAQVWREVQGIYAARDPAVVSRAAIPLYQNNTNDTDLSREQLETLSRRLARERSSRDDIVGLPYEEAHRIQVPVRRDSQLQSRRHGSPTHADPNSQPTSSTRRRGETLPPMSGALRRSRTTTEAEIGPSHHSHSAGRDEAVSEGAPITPLDVSTDSPGASAVAAPRPPAAAASSPSTGAAAAAPRGNTFTHTNTGRAQLPTHRLETPQLGPSTGGNANGFDTSPLMGASPGLVNASFTSSQFGGNSVQYQLPGARYLSADEIRGAETAVAVDQHTVLMSQTPLSAEAAVHAFLANSELNVADILSKSLTAMQTTAPPEKRPDSAGRAKDGRRDSKVKSGPASPGGRRGRSGPRSARDNDASVET